MTNDYDSRQTTDGSEQNNTGLFGGLIIINGAIKYDERKCGGLLLARLMGQYCFAR